MEKDEKERIEDVQETDASAEDAQPESLSETEPAELGVATILTKLLEADLPQPVSLRLARTRARLKGVWHATATADAGICRQSKDD